MIGPFKTGNVHVIERLVFFFVERCDEPFRIQHFPLPGVVQVNHVPGLCAAATEIVDRSWVGDKHLRIDLRSGLAAEGIQNGLFGITFPRMDIEFHPVITAGKISFCLFPELVCIVGTGICTDRHCR